MSERPRVVGASASQSRRQFLARSAIATGAAAVLASTAGAASRRTGTVRAQPRVPLAEGETIRMGVIGTGGMGTGHCQAITELVKQDREKVSIAAVCDVCEPRMADAKRIVEAAQGASIEGYSDYRTMLARPDLHAVLIASPEHWHAQHAIDAIAAGKDVYVEKPMTLNLDMAIALYQAARANPEVIVQVGTQMMQLPKYHEAKRVIKSGLIGAPTCSQTSYCRNSKDGEWQYYKIDPAWKPGQNLDWDSWCGPMGPAPWKPEVYARWRRYRSYSTGIIGDLLVHVMTPLMMSLDAGWPTRVVATGGHYVDKAMENHDQVNLTVQFERDHTMIVAGSTCNEVGLETLIRGHKGNIYLGGRHCVVRPERIYADEVEEQTIECPDIGNDQDKHRLDWFRCIRTREQPPATVELGTQVMVVVDLATRAIWEGGAYVFDPATMTARRA